MLAFGLLPFWLDMSGYMGRTIFTSIGGCRFLVAIALRVLSFSLSIMCRPLKTQGLAKEYIVLFFMGRRSEYCVASIWVSMGLMMFSSCVICIIKDMASEPGILERSGALTTMMIKMREGNGVEGLR